VVATTIIAPESLKEWKMEIISVKQRYESIEGRQNYKTESGITYRGREALMDIRKSKDNYNKDGKFRCFNCNVYRYIAKDCQKLKNKKETRKCYKYNKVGHFAKNCRLGQKIKNKSVQEESDDEDNNKEGGLVRGLE